MRSDLRRARGLGLTAAALGGTAGAAQLLVGTTVWTGNKNDPTTLGVVTILLAIIIAVASLTGSTASTPGRAFAASVGQGIPSLIGRTTAGLAWAPAAVAGVTAAVFALRAAHHRGSLGEIAERNWSGILLSAMAMLYVAVGIAALGLAGIIGILGGLFVLTSLALPRKSRWTAAALLTVGALPFAALTMSAVVTPLTALLILLIGLPSLLGPGTRGVTGNPVEGPPIIDET